MNKKYLIIFAIMAFKIYTQEINSIDQLLGIEKYLQLTKLRTNKSRLYRRLKNLIPFKNLFPTEMESLLRCIEILQNDHEEPMQDSDILNARNAIFQKIGLAENSFEETVKRMLDESLDELDRYEVMADYEAIVNNTTMINLEYKKLIIQLILEQHEYIQILARTGQDQSEASIILNSISESTVIPQIINDRYILLNIRQAISMNVYNELVEQFTAQLNYHFECCNTSQKLIFERFYKSNELSWEKRESFSRARLKIWQDIEQAVNDIKQKEALLLSDSELMQLAIDNF